MFLNKFHVKQKPYEVNEFHNKNYKQVTGNHINLANYLFISYNLHVVIATTLVVWQKCYFEIFPSLLVRKFDLLNRPQQLTMK